MARDCDDGDNGIDDGVGILLSNLGTPSEPTAKGVRRYLRQFLSDKRVVDTPRIFWRPLLELIILPIRSRKVARNYQTIWTDDGSPLLAIGRRVAAKMQETIADRIGRSIPVVLGMRYGAPSMESALDKLRDAGCRRVLHLPLYPQYSATTTASNIDEVARLLMKRRAIPELRTVNSYAVDDGYIGALANSVREEWSANGEPDRLLVSFHGIPQRYERLGDPYPEECRATARALQEELDLGNDRFFLCFQSRFGPEPWLEPYTDKTLEAWAEEGVESVDVICPGFSADCLETVEEIDEQNREIFLEGGGERFRYIAALNDRDDHVAALADVALRNVAGWLPETRSEVTP